MATLTGGNDEQLAAGLVFGGGACLLGGTEIAKCAAVKLGALGTLKTGIVWGATANPVGATVLLVGGAGYLLYKWLK